MPQPMTLPKYSYMVIGSQEEIIDEHIMMNALLIICLEMVVGCNTRLQSMANLGWMLRWWWCWWLWRLRWKWCRLGFVDASGDEDGDLANTLVLFWCQPFQKVGGLDTMVPWALRAHALVSDTVLCSGTFQCLPLDLPYLPFALFQICIWFSTCMAQFLWKQHLERNFGILCIH